MCCFTVVFELLALSIWGAQFHQHLQHSVTDPVCCVTVVFELLALSIWGAQFHQHLQHSVLWREEKLQDWTTDGLASLGYSYW